MVSAPPLQGTQATTRYFNVSYPSCIAETAVVPAARRTRDDDLETPQGQKPASRDKIELMVSRGEGETEEKEDAVDVIQ